MFKKIAGFLSALALIFTSSLALAQTSVAPWTVTSTGTNGAPIYCSVGNGSAGSCPMPVTVSGSGSSVTANQGTPNSAANAWPVVPYSPAASARNFPGCTVGNTNTNCLATSTAVNFLQIQNTSTSASIACAFGTAAVLNSKTSVQLAVGQSASWGPNTDGVPSGELECIASTGSTPLYVEWN